MFGIRRGGWRPATALRSSSSPKSRSLASGFRYPRALRRAGGRGRSHGRTGCLSAGHAVMRSCCHAVMRESVSNNASSLNGPYRATGLPRPGSPTKPSRSSYAAGMLHEDPGLAEVRGASSSAELHRLLITGHLSSRSADYREAVGLLRQFHGDDPRGAADTALLLMLNGRWHPYTMKVVGDIVACGVLDDAALDAPWRIGCCGRAARPAPIR